MGASKSVSEVGDRLGIIFKPVSEDDYDAAYTLQTASHSFPWSRSQFLDCLTPLTIVIKCA